jgi:predicted HicB family RNase H-like nuclease
MGGGSQDLGSILLSPPVLVTFIICAFLAALALWLASAWQRRQRQTALNEQRENQETAIERILDSVARDKEEVVADYEGQLRARDERIASLEREVARLRERVTSTGILSLFGGRQRDVVGALLLENEQLHELLAQKQDQLRELMTDMSGKLLARLDEQAQESARAVRYKQALLSAFLQHDEARRILDRLIAEGKVVGAALPEPPREEAGTPSSASATGDPPT